MTTNVTDPSAPQNPPAPAAAAPPPPAAPAAPSQTDPAWINDRIAQAKRSERETLLKELGVTDPAQAKAAIEAARAADEAKKSSDTRLAETTSALETERQKNATLAAAVKAQADAAVKDLTPQQLAAVTAVAGEDPAKQLTAIAALRPTWAAAPTAPAPVAAPVAPTAPAAPTNTAPPRAAPPAGPTAPTDHLAAYTALRGANPFAAAAYRREHAADIAAAEDKQT
jgi:hypothetical protein